MHWVEIRTDGSYVYEGQEFPLLTEGIEQHEATETERYGTEWAKTEIPFYLETPHGSFGWIVEIIEYFELGVASYVGASICTFPAKVFLKEEVTFTLQDGWDSPLKPILDLKP